jgi:hypothetical protein
MEPLAGIVNRFDQEGSAAENCVGQRAAAQWTKT